MATSAQYVTQPILDYVQISTANTNRDGTGTLGTLTTGPNTTAGNGVGKRIFRIVIQSTGTTTAGVIRFYISNDNGSTKRLICEKIVPAITPSTSIPAWRTEVIELNNLVLPGGTGNIIYVSTNNGEVFNIMCESATL